MKTLLYILIFSIGTISFAQDPQLFENEWYLQKVITEGQEIFPPYSNFIGRLYLTADFIEVVHPSCEEGFYNTVDYDSSNPVFSIGDGGVIIVGICGDPEVINFMNQHYEVYYLDNNFAKNPFTYTLTSENGLITLSILNMDGDEAIYVNQLLSTHTILASQFLIHPNPVKERLTLSATKATPNLKIKIFNIAGKLLSTQNFEFKKQVSVDVSNLSSGIYFLNIQDESGNTEVKKFIKE